MTLLDTHAFRWFIIDRLLIAQSLVEQMPLVSADPEFDAYGIRRLW